MEIDHVAHICMKLHCANSEESFIHHSFATLSRVFSNIHYSAEVYQLKPFRLKERSTHFSDNESRVLMLKQHMLNHPDAQRVIVISNSDTDKVHLEPPAALHYSILCTYFHDRVQAPCQLWIGIRDGNELLNCIYSREGKCSEEQIAMLCLIQSDLETAWKNWKRIRSLKEELDLIKGSIFHTKEEETCAARLRKLMDALTPRQRDVVELVAAGNDNQQVADELNISVLTVKKHLGAIFKSLDIHHRTELTARWHQSILFTYLEEANLSRQIFTGHSPNEKGGIQPPLDSSGSLS